MVILRNEMVEDEEPHGDVEQCKADDRQAHNSTAAESDLQTLVKALASAIGGTRGGVCSGLHTEEACQTGEETAGQESEPDPAVLQVKDRHNEEQHRKDYEHDGHHLVLLFQVGHSAFTHVSGDFTHCRSTLIFFQHSAIKEEGKSQCHDGRTKHDPYILYKIFHKSF